jgi:hypothetical protein
MLPKYGHGYLLHWSGALFLAPSLWPAKGNYVSAGPSKELFLFKLMPLWRFENSHSCQDLCLYFPLNSYKLFCGYSLPTQGINCYSLSVALIWQPLPQPLEPDPCLAPVLFYFIFGHSFLVINLFFFFLAPPTNTVRFSFSPLLWNMTFPTQLDCPFLSVFPDTCQHSA